MLYSRNLCCINFLEKLPGNNELNKIVGAINKTAGRVDFVYKLDWSLNNLLCNPTLVEHLKKLIQRRELVVATIKDANHPNNGEIVGCIHTMPHSENFSDSGVPRDLTVQHSGMFMVREEFPDFFPIFPKCQNRPF